MRLDLSVAVIGLGGPAHDLVEQAVAAAGCVRVERQADAVIVGCELPPPTVLADLPLDAWTGSVERRLGETLEALITARGCLRGGRGSIVVITTTLGIAGGAELVALTTLTEGIRAMAKSAARQWAPDGVVVNQLALPLGLLDPSLEPLTAHLPPPPGGSPSIADVGTVLASLLQAPPTMVGAIVVLDGGSVMAP